MLGYPGALDLHGDVGALPAHGLRKSHWASSSVSAPVCLAQSTRRLSVNASFLQRDAVSLRFLCFRKQISSFLLLRSIKGEELLGFSICLSLVMLLCFLFAFLPPSHSENKPVGFVSFLFKYSVLVHVQDAVTFGLADNTWSCNFL